MTDALSDSFDTRIRCQNLGCYQQFEPYEVKRVNGRACCPHCGRLLHAKNIILEKKVTVTLIENLDLSFEYKQEELEKLLRDGYVIVGWE